MRKWIPLAISFVLFIIFGSVNRVQYYDDISIEDWLEDCNPTKVDQLSATCLKLLMELSHPTGIYQNDKLIAWNDDRLAINLKDNKHVLKSRQASNGQVAVSLHLSRNNNLQRHAQTNVVAPLLYLIFTVLVHLLLFRLIPYPFRSISNIVLFFGSLVLFYALTYIFALIGLLSFDDIAQHPTAQTTIIHFSILLTSLYLLLCRDDTLFQKSLTLIQRFIFSGLSYSLIIVFLLYTFHYHGWMMKQHHIVALSKFNASETWRILMIWSGAAFLLGFISIFGILLVRIIQNFSLKFKQRMTIFSLALILVLGIALMFDLRITPVFALSTIIFILLLDMTAEARKVNLLWTSTWMIAISFISAIAISSFVSRSQTQRIEKEASHALKDLEDQRLDIIGASKPGDQWEVYKNDKRIFPLSELKIDKNKFRSNTFSNRQYTLKVHTPNSSFILFMSYFSICFITCFFLALSGMVLSSLYKNYKKGSFIGRTFMLRHKIELAIIGSVLTSFALIGLVTFIIEQSEGHRSKESFKTNISNTIKEIIRNSENNINKDLIQLSNAYKGSINIYNRDFANIDGSISSNRLMHPATTQSLRINNKINKDIIKFDTPESGPIYVDLGENRKTIWAKMSESLVSKLINLYVFLFLFGLGLAYFLSNYITRPLELLGKKLGDIQVGKKHEELQWRNSDEIGMLISQYNSMLSQIENSADMMAKSERNTAWKEMAKQVAHEIKNPLTPMKLTIQHLQMRAKSQSGDLAEQVNRMSKTLIEQIDNLSRIANEFSNFGQMPSASNEKIIINDIVTSVHDLFRKREDMEIHCNVPIDELYVFADRDHLIRILNNVVKNAIQSIPYNKEGRISIKLSSKNNLAIIKVEDNGEGIPEDMIDKVFRPNFTTKSAGTGLGLAMCAKMIESLNGRIYFETEVDKGTTFFIEIPLMHLDENFPQEHVVLQ